MDRLTTMSKYGNPEYLWEANTENGCYRIYNEDLLVAQIKRLAAYEDTGMLPEELMELLSEKSVWKVASELLGVSLDRLQALIHAERDGRLVVLPQDNGKGFALCAISHLEGEFYNVDVKSVGDPKELPSLLSYLVHYMAESLGVGYHDLLRAMLKEPSVIDAATEGGDEA